MKNLCKTKTGSACTYIVTEKIYESDSIFSLKIKLKDGEIPTYNSGQFINIYFPELGTPEGKAYSISSSPQESALMITVRIIGEFSKKLSRLNVGDAFNGSLPYGYFYSESKESKLIMIAGGIGITPFRSMIYDSILQNSSRKITLFYSSRIYKDLVFKKQLDKLAIDHGNFQAHYFLTRESTSDIEISKGRIGIDSIIKNIKNDDSQDNEFLICGSISFVGDIWKSLRSAGIAEDVIYTEAFFSH